MIAASDQIAGIGYAANPDVDLSLDKSEDILYNLRHGKSQRVFVHIRDILDDIIEAESPQEEDELKPSEMPQVPSGFSSLDAFLGISALRPGDRRRSSQYGQTSLALNIARNAAVELMPALPCSAWKCRGESLGAAWLPVRLQ